MLLAAVFGALLVPFFGDALGFGCAWALRLGFGDALTFADLDFVFALALAFALVLV